ncbi:MAG: cytochrome ubiquinol oxidase subunit I [Thiohalomonadaceae bacterium]
MELDPLLLSRIQFGFVVSFHILFPAFTIGLASFIVVLEALWLRRGSELYFRLAQFWTRLFAVSFAMGVVSGIVMSYQFGTNWSRFSHATANIIGPLLGYEVLTAFFLEATFLGVMLFGRDRVSPGFHFFSALMVAIGTLISAFWILAANSWMQTPSGYELRNDIFHPAGWLSIIFNPSFPYRLAHMVAAAFLTTAFVVIGISAWFLRQGRYREESGITLRLGLGLAALLAPAQLVIGDLHGLNTFEHQPAKIAAMEGHWEDQRGAPLLLFALPDEAAERNRWAVAIPLLGSLILTHDAQGEVPGLKRFAAEDRPPVAPVFWSFRIMVAMGAWMIFLAWRGQWLRWRGRLETSPGYLRLCTWSIPVGFVALIAGWLTTEIGRQPWTVYGLLRTADSVSPVAGVSVLISLLAFIVAYAIIFGFGTYYLGKIVRAGLKPFTPTGEPHTAMRPISGADQLIGRAED